MGLAGALRSEERDGGDPLYPLYSKPKYEGTLMYKLSYRIADTIWPDVIIDVVSVGCYAWATYQVLADYVSPVTGASA